METNQTQLSTDQSLQNLERFAELLDNKFRIPGTNIRFGLDGLIGLIPFAGDVFTLIVSGYLLMLLIKKGASGMILVKMTWNIIIDALIGTIPLLGDLFDFSFRANTKNIQLMKEFLAEGKHQGSAWPVILLLIGVFVVLIALAIWAMWALFSWVIS